MQEKCNKKEFRKFRKSVENVVYICAGREAFMCKQVAQVILKDRLKS